jgi:uncharacterized protein YkwD
MKEFFKAFLSLITFGLYKYKKVVKGKYDDVVLEPQNLIKWDDFSQQVLDRVNVFRFSEGLSPFVKEDSHYRVASARAHFFSDILGFMSEHTSFPTYAERLEKIGAKGVAENLSWKYATPKGVVGAWKRSKGKWVVDGKTVSEDTPGAWYKKGHRDILLGDYKYAGIGFAPDPNAVCLMVSKK